MPQTHWFKIIILHYMLTINVSDQHGKGNGSWKEMDIGLPLTKSPKIKAFYLGIMEKTVFICLLDKGVTLSSHSLKNALIKVPCFLYKTISKAGF